MNLEIERKFLVKNNDYKNQAYHKSYIKQGFLNSDKERTVRIRIMDEKAFITIKGKSNNEGTTRFEWEKEISIKEAQDLMLLTEKGMIEKYRYFVKNNHHIYEVDEFFGDNTGLVIAEIELSKENEYFDKPTWLGKEVTGNIKYYNSSLKNIPYNSWA